MDRRAALKAVAALGALPAARTWAQAGYPARPIHIIVPFTPGGSTDILARAIGQALTESWRQQVIVENKPGAGGAIGAEAAAKASPDGYTLFMGHIGTLAVNPTLYAKLPYDAVADFAPVALVAMVPNVLVVNPAIPARSVAELIALAQAKPGGLSCSSGGSGSAAHLAIEYFKLATGTDILHVPYKGQGEAVTGVVGGQVDLVFSSIGAIGPHVKNGKMRPFAIASAKRFAGTPDVPTFAESGFPGVEIAAWLGLLMPSGTPPEIVARVNREVSKAMEDAEVRARMARLGYLPVGGTPDVLGELIRNDFARFGKIARDANIRIN